MLHLRVPHAVIGAALGLATLSERRMDVSAPPLAPSASTVERASVGPPPRETGPGRGVPIVAQPGPGRPGAWTAHLLRMDQALGRRDAAAARRAWREARDAALRADGWEALAEVGDAAVRLVEAGETPGTAVTRARESYELALGRVRQAGSLDGALRLAEAFADLDDAEAVERCLRLARQLAGGRPEEQADVRAVAERLGR